jgi:hypothetical protein
VAEELAGRTLEHCIQARTTSPAKAAEHYLRTLGDRPLPHGSQPGRITYLFVQKPSKNLPPRTNKQMTARPSRSGHTAIFYRRRSLQSLLKSRGRKKDGRAAKHQSVCLPGFLPP